MPSLEEDRMRGTGGNRFIEPDATCGDLLRSINDQLGDLREWATETGRVFDIADDQHHAHPRAGESAYP